MWWHDDESPEEERTIRHLPFREMLRRVLPLFRPHLGLLIPGFLLLLVTVGAELAGPIVLRRIIDQSIPEGSPGGIIRNALLYAALFAVGTTAGYFQVVLLTKMGLRIVRRLKQSLFDHLLGLSLAYFDRNPPGRLLARVESDTERLQALFSEVALAVLRTMILVAGTLVVMLLASWQATVALLCLALPIVLGTIFYFRWMRGLFRRVRSYYARISTFVSEYVQGVPILQVFGYERRAAERLARLNDDKVRLERTTTALEYGFWGLLTTVEVAAVMLILMIGSGRLFEATLTVGTIVLFIDYTRRIFWPLAMFSPCAKPS